LESSGDSPGGTVSSTEDTGLFDVASSNEVSVDVRLPRHIYLILSSSELAVKKRKGRDNKNPNKDSGIYIKFTESYQFLNISIRFKVT
jgi:hypothetical protein